jgi:hypothetical protein
MKVKQDREAPKVIDKRSMAERAHDGLFDDFSNGKWKRSEDDNNNGEIWKKKMMLVYPEAINDKRLDSLLRLIT